MNVLRGAVFTAVCCVAVGAFGGVGVAGVINRVAPDYFPTVFLSGAPERYSVEAGERAGLIEGGFLGLAVGAACAAGLGGLGMLTWRACLVGPAALALTAAVCAAAGGLIGSALGNANPIYYLAVFDAGRAETNPADLAAGLGIVQGAMAGFVAGGSGVLAWAWRRAKALPASS